MVRATAVFALALGASACGAPWEPEALDRVCDDVGFSIAAVAFECTSSEARAQAAFDAFGDRYRCRIADIHDPVEPDLGNGKNTWATGVPLEVYYTCPAAVGAADCAAYTGFARDDFAAMDDWLGLAPACATILERADGTRLPVDEP